MTWPFIAEPEQVLFASPEPERLFCATPSLTRLPSGRLLATFDLSGPGTAALSGPRAIHGDFDLPSQGRVCISDDDGHTWRQTAEIPMYHIRAFHGRGDTVWLLGHDHQLMVCRSIDGGDHFEEPVVLDDNARWHQSACSADWRHGRCYLTMEQVRPGTTWPGIAPVLMSIGQEDDWRERRNWRFSAPLDWTRMVPLPTSCGVPFFPTGPVSPGEPTRFCGAPGVLESNVVRLYDPLHPFYDPADRTVLAFMRAHTGRTNLAAVAAGCEGPDGSLHWKLLTTPAGTKLAYVPFPGGQMKFQILYDEGSQFYWLVSSQASDSMRKPETLPQKRYGLPDNERNRLALHFSRNCFDWCFAGMIAVGAQPNESRHYASLAIVGKDLLVASRSGSPRAMNSHNCDQITLHRIRDFRKLLY